MKTLYTTDYDFGFRFEDFYGMKDLLQLDIDDMKYYEPENVDEIYETTRRLHKAEDEMYNLISEFTVEPGTLFEINDEVVLVLDEGWFFKGAVFNNVWPILETWMDV